MSMVSRGEVATALLLCTAVASPWALAAADPQGSDAAAAATAPVPSATNDRLLFSGNGSWLTGPHGGGGGSITWLRGFASGNLFGLGAEYQTLYNSHWTLGNVNGALTFMPGGIKTTLYAEAHLGTGDTAGVSFHYTNVAGGFITTPAAWLSVQLEERYIDVQPSRGHLPKVGLTFRLAPALIAAVSYAQSFGGNLDTKLGTARLDYSGTHFSWLIGGAYGPTSPIVLNFIGGQQTAFARKLKEGFVGAGKTFGPTDWLLIGDYQDLEGFKRTTVTLNCTLHLGRRSTPR
jgi:hypothetical protein